MNTNVNVLKEGKVNDMLGKQIITSMKATGREKTISELDQKQRNIFFKMYIYKSKLNNAG